MPGQVCNKDQVIVFDTDGSVKVRNDIPPDLGTQYVEHVNHEVEEHFWTQRKIYKIGEIVVRMRGADYVYRTMTREM